MLAALLTLSALTQEALPTTPVVPPGANRSFHEAVLAVETEMSKGNFDAAKRLMKALPTLKATITWDDSKVPAAMRVAFAEARDNAIKSWKTSGLPVDFKIGPKGHMVFRFDDVLPDTELGIPAGAGHLFSFDPAEPRLQTVIGLSRGKPANKTLPSEVTNEVGHAIAAYVGLEQSKAATGIRFRTDMPSNGLMPVSQGDVFLAMRVLKVVDALEKGIEKKVKFEPKKPTLFIESSHVTQPPVVQGEAQSFSLTVTNNGDGPLTLWVEPDCSCLAPNAPNVIGPGQTGLIRVMVNTVDWVGKLRKWLYVYSNDLEFPFRQIPVDVDIVPLYRFIKPGPQVIQMTDKGAVAEFLFWTPDLTKIKPDQVRLSGMQGEVVMEDWEGEAADPELGEGTKKRKGVKFIVNFPPRQIFGRVPTTLTVTTNNQFFPVIRANVQVQRGVVALPERVYLGEIPRGATRATFIISRPETNFKIKKLSTDSPHVKVTSRPVKGEWEYRIDIEIDSKIEIGFFNANVHILTDDPQQAEIVVPIEATVR